MPPPNTPLAVVLVPEMMARTIANQQSAVIKTVHYTCPIASRWPPLLSHRWSAPLPGSVVVSSWPPWGTRLPRSGRSPSRTRR